MHSGRHFPPKSGGDRPSTNQRARRQDIGREETTTRNVQVAIQHEKLFPGVLHDMLAQIVNEVGDCRRAAILVGGGHGQRMVALVCKEHFETAAGSHSSAYDKSNAYLRLFYGFEDTLRTGMKLVVKKGIKGAHNGTEELTRIPPPRAAWLLALYRWRRP